MSENRLQKYKNKGKEVAVSSNLLPNGHHFDSHCCSHEAKIIMQYYLVPCRLSSAPKMYDLDWLFHAKICFRAGLAA